MQIDTSWAATGLGGVMQRLFAPAALRRIYAKELELLEGYAGDKLGIGQVLTVVVEG